MYNILCYDFFFVNFHGRKATVTPGGEAGDLVVRVATSSPTWPGGRTRRRLARDGGVGKRVARSIRTSPP